MSLTLIERKNIITDVAYKSIQLKIQLIPDIWKIFKEFIINGVNQEHDIIMQDTNQQLVIRLYNNKKRESYVCLRKK